MRRAAVSSLQRVLSQPAMGQVFVFLVVLVLVELIMVDPLLLIVCSFKRVKSFNNYWVFRSITKIISEIQTIGPVKIMESL